MTKRQAKHRKMRGCNIVPSARIIHSLFGRGNSVFAAAFLFGWLVFPAFLWAILDSLCFKNH